MNFPVLWLDNEKFLTQRDHGRLVTVDLTGKVTEIAVIKDAPKLASPSLGRDRAGDVFYCIAGECYKIDPAKKTAERSEWASLGHGFEASRKKDDKLGYKLRHNGKDISQFHWSWFEETAPGYIAVVVNDAEGIMAYEPRSVAVWSAVTGEWTVQKYEWLSVAPIVGWIK
jgi:hypothetical protein